MLYKTDLPELKHNHLGFSAMLLKSEGEEDREARRKKSRNGKSNF